MEAQAAQVPPQMKPMFEFMKKKMTERLQQLDGGAAQSAPAAAPAGK